MNSFSATRDAEFLAERYLPSLSLSRLGDESEAGLWISSLPVPRAKNSDLSLNGQPTYSRALGQWPGAAPSTPRRLLLVADGQNSAPETLSLQSQKPLAAAPALPLAAMELIEASPHFEYPWERHFLRVEYSGLEYSRRAMGIALGLRTSGKVHWWEACRVVEIERTSQCLVLEMGGAIPHRVMDIETFRGHGGLSNPFLHKHNWLSGHLFLRLHANGVCEVFARHVNSKFFDDGLDLEDVVPVVGFRLMDDEARSDGDSLSGAWDGTRGEIQLGGARFDLKETARLSTPSQPGRMDVENDFLVWQPYQGFELFGGTCPRQLIGDEFILRGEDHKVLRGMSRTLRFSFSLSSRSPRVARYLAPAWWYGACEEFSPAPYLPVSNRYDEDVNWARKWVLESMVDGGFEDGAVPRHARFDLFGNEPEEKPARDEPGWEGEIPHGQFLAAWRSGEEKDYNAALRSATHFSDLAIDHAAKIVRMHGYPPHAFALPMARLQATIAAYLETGDPFLLETAEAVTANSFWMHKNSWPRLAVGRDACFIRSAVMLYRYFDNDYFRKMAVEGIEDVAQAQRADGSFGDQGGGTGLHQWGAYITKPWMALLATMGVLDYLELFPDDELCLKVVRKTADWLMSERVERNGIMGWCYQHGFRNTREFYDPFLEASRELPDKAWHQENIGRLMLFCAQKFGDASYMDAWAQSHAARRGALKGRGGDHYVSTVFQFLTRMQDHLWRAKLTPHGIEIEPTHFGALTPQDAIIHAPEGELKLRWNDDGKVEAPPGVLQSR